MIREYENASHVPQSPTTSRSFLHIYALTAPPARRSTGLRMVALCRELWHLPRSVQTPSPTREYDHLGVELTFQPLIYVKVRQGAQSSSYYYATVNKLRLAPFMS